MKEKIYFAKIKDEAQIPSKRDSDFGFDLYACFNEDEIIIRPNEVKIINTGIISAFSKKYGCLIEERGSTGTKCMSVRAGVFDSNYRGEWLIPINNTSNKVIRISKAFDSVMENDLEIFYPYKKAVAQACFFVNPKLKVEEVDVSFINEMTSVRGDGRLGSTGK